MRARRAAEGQEVSFRAFAFDPNNPGFVPPDRHADGTLSVLEGTDPTVTYFDSPVVVDNVAQQIISDE